MQLAFKDSNRPLSGGRQMLQMQQSLVLFLPQRVLPGLLLWKLLENEPWHDWQRRAPVAVTPKQTQPRLRINVVLFLFIIICLKFDCPHLFNWPQNSSSFFFFFYSIFDTSKWINLMKSSINLNKIVKKNFIFKNLI